MSKGRGLFGGRASAQPTETMQSNVERQVAGRPHVGSSKGHHKIYISSPRADTLHREQDRPGLFVRQSRETGQVQPSRQEKVREFGEIRRLLTRDP